MTLSITATAQPAYTTVDGGTPAACMSLMPANPTLITAETNPQSLGRRLDMVAAYTQEDFLKSLDRLHDERLITLKLVYTI